MIDNSFGVVNTPITFDGGGSPGSPGDRMLVVGTTGNDTLTLTPTTTTTASMSLDGSAAYSFTNIQNVAFYGATGNDELEVDNSTSLLTVPVFYDGDNGYNFVAAGFGDPPTQGNGFNKLVITQTGGATQTSDTYTVGPNPGEGSDVIVGGGNTQTIQFENLAPVQDNVPALVATVNATPAANAINYTQGSGGGIFGAATTGFVTIDNQESYEFANKTSLTINGLAGSDEINLNDPTTPTGLTGGITINGGDPTASDRLVVNGAAAQDTVNIAPGTADGGTVAITGLPPITFAAIESLIYNGQGGNDLLTVSVPAASTTNYSPGPTNDAASLRVGSLAPLSYTNLGNGGQGVQISAAGTGASLLYNGTSLDDTFSVIGLTGTTRGQIVLNSRLPVVTNANVTALDLPGGDGDDVFNLTNSVAAPLPYTAVRIEGGNPAASDIANSDRRHRPRDRESGGQHAFHRHHDHRIRRHRDAKRRRDCQSGRQQQHHVVRWHLAERQDHLHAHGRRGSLRAERRPQYGLQCFQRSRQLDRLWRQRRQRRRGRRPGHAAHATCSRSTKARPWRRFWPTTSTRCCRCSLAPTCRCLTALGLGGEDTFQVIPAAGIGAFPLDNLLINIDGGDPQSNDALVVASSFGSVAGRVAGERVCGPQPRTRRQFGHGPRLLGRNHAIPGHQLQERRDGQCRTSPAQGR